MKQETIIVLKEKGEKLDTLKDEFQVKRDQFNKDNEQLTELIMQEQSDYDAIKNDIKSDAEDEFKQTGNKKLLGGIAIRILSRLEYNDVDAINWARDKMPVILKEVIDKKQFEAFAKTNDLDFVTKKETVSVTFPKEIII